MKMQCWVEMERVEPMLRALNYMTKLPNIWFVPAIGRAKLIAQNALNIYHERDTVYLEAKLKPFNILYGTSKESVDNEQAT